MEAIDATSARPLAGRRALVTGATGGIGRPLAEALAREGASVAVHHLGEDAEARALAAALTAPGQRSAALEADLRRPAELERLVRDTVAALGGLDLLVNNAGVTGWNAALEVDEALWDRVIDTNLKGTFFASLAAARHMRDHGGGAILNVSSILATACMRNLTVYAASKAGINTLTRQLALELAPHGIRVNAIAPGPILVERTLADDPDYAENWGKVAPLGRVGTPADLFGAALLLCSPAAAWVTGQIWTVDGGVSLPARIPEASVDRGLAHNRG